MIKTIGWIFFTFWLIAIIVIIGIAFYSGYNETDISTTQTTETTVPSDSVPSGDEADTGEIPKPELTLADAADIFNLTNELPSGFSFSGGSEAETSDLLGIGSPSYFLVRGTVIDSNGLPGTDWYEIQCILWIVDEATATQVNIADIAATWWDTQSVDIDASVDALLYIDDFSDEDTTKGLESLILKYNRVFIKISVGYVFPSGGEYVSLVDLGKAIVERLKEYSLPD